MAISTRVAAPSNPGAVEGGNANITDYATRVELFQTIFTGHVINKVKVGSIYKNLTTVKTITNGVSARFEVLGRTTGEYMKAGDSLGGGGINHNKVEVSLDDMFVSHVSIFWPDEDQLHFEAIPRYADICAVAQINHYDLNVFRTAVKASKTSTPVVADYPEQVGTELTYLVAGDENDMEKVKTMIVDALSVQKAKGYKPSELKMILGTSLMSRLRKDDDFVSVDRGADGSIAEGNGTRYMGIELIEDVYWDDKAIAHSGTWEGKYDVDAYNLHFIILAMDATATVELYGIKPLMFDFDKEQSTYLGSYAKVGHGVLNPGGAVTAWIQNS